MAVQQQQRRALPARRTCSATPSRSISKGVEAIQHGGDSGIARRRPQAIIRQSILSQSATMNPHSTAPTSNSLLAIRDARQPGRRRCRGRRRALGRHQAAGRAGGAAGPASCSSAPRGGCVPTAEGEALCERASGLLAGFAGARSRAAGAPHASRSGRIRLAATFGFGRLWLGPGARGVPGSAIRGCEVQLQLTEQLPDLAVEGFDGAVWLWAVRGQRARRMDRRGASRATSACWWPRPPTCAARHARPAVEDLAAHDCLVVRENDAARSTSGALQHGTRRAPRRACGCSGPLSSNSGELVRDWCLAGRGIMLRSLWDIAPQLAVGRAGARAARPTRCPTPTSTGWRRTRPSTPRRIRLLVDFLAERFRGEPWKPSGALRRRAAPPGSRRRR